MRGMTTGKTRVIWLTAFAVAAGALCMMVLTAPAQKAASANPYPVLLIHGLASSPDSWQNLPKYLENRGFTVYVMDFSDWEWLPYANKVKKDMHDLAAVIARQISVIREETGRPKVNIIAHSFAGLAVRAYIADWGAKIESRGKYSGDINKVIYVATPHYGTRFSSTALRKMVKDTDYGKFLSYPSSIVSAMAPASEESLELHDFFAQNRDNLGIEQVTISSTGDNIVQLYSANLDGIKVEPLAPSANVESNHINLKSYAHAYHDILGRPSKTLIGVGSTNHPLLNIAKQLFANSDTWRKYQTDINKESSIVMLRMAKNSGVDSASLNVGNLILRKVMSPKRMKRIKMERNASSKTFYVTGIKSGVYQMEMPYKGEQVAFKFSMDVAGGSGSLVTFNPKDPPPEPDSGGSGDSDRPDEPDDVYDYATLVQFTKAHFPKKAGVWQSGDTISGLVRHLRAKLAARYGNIEDDFYGNEERLDLFHLIKTDEYVDFCAGPDSDGILLNKLQWTYVDYDDEPPEPDDGGGDDGGDDGGGGGGGTQDPHFSTNPKKSDFQEAFYNWPNSAKTKYYSKLTWICGEFRNWLSNTCYNVERVNDQYERHRYSTSSEDRHADVVMVIRDAGNPSLDIIVDFCYGSSEAGYLYSKLQCLWHDGPYDWWVDNAFLLK